MSWDTTKKNMGSAQKKMKGIRDKIIDYIPNQFQRTVVKVAAYMGDKEISMMQRNFSAFIAAFARNGKGKVQTQTAAKKELMKEKAVFTQKRPQPTPAQIEARAAQMDDRPSQNQSQERAQGRGQERV